jgi:hypothetical protein
MNLNEMWVDAKDEAEAQLQLEAAIGRLVLAKFKTANGVEIERVVIRLSELEALRNG